MWWMFPNWNLDETFFEFLCSCSNTCYNFQTVLCSKCVLLFQFNRKIAERTFVYQLVGNATFSVDTFFFVSGLLVVLLFLKTEKTKKQAAEANGTSEVSTGQFMCNSFRKSFLLIFYRFLRLTPTYLVVVTFTELSMKWVYILKIHVETRKTSFFKNDLFKLIHLQSFNFYSSDSCTTSQYLAQHFSTTLTATNSGGETFCT